MDEDRRLAAIMFTDIIGYTSLMTADEKKTLELLEKNMSIQKPIIKKYKGQYIKEIGDGTLSCFTSAVNAVRSAMEIQNEINKEPSFKLRIGIHLGDIVFKENDIFGMGVNIASRLETSASPGTIFISGQVFDLINNITDINPVFIGKRELKNVQSPIDIYKIEPDASHAPILKNAIHDNNFGLIKTSREKSILVLPFQDLGPEKVNRYIIDGLCDEIINDLSLIPGLKVISRTSALLYSDSGKSLKDICSERNILYAIEGSIKKSKNELRIMAELKEVFKDNQLCTFKFKGQIDRIFEFQENVSRSIADTLKIKLSPAAETRINQRNTDSFSVLECYLKARQDIFHGQKKDLEHAIEILEEGLARFGESGLLYGGLGTAYWQYLNYGYSSDPDYFQKIMDLAEKIFDLNPQSPHGFQLMGIINYKYGKVEQAAKMFKASFSANMNDPVTLYFLAIIYGNMERMKPAKIFAKRLAEIDPMIGMSQLVPAIIYYFEGKFEKAVEIGKKVYDNNSTDPVILFYFGVFNASIGHEQESHELFDLNFHRNPDHLYANLSLLFKYALSGTKQLVLQGISKYLSEVAVGDEELSIWMADIYSLINEKELAIKWIQNAAKKGFINYSFFKSLDPFLKNIRKDNQFKETMEDIKLMNKAFKE